MRVGPNLPGQVGAPLEHTAHQQNPINWSNNFQSAAAAWPVNFRAALSSVLIHIPDGTSPLHTMQLQPTGKFVLAQKKTLHNETKLFCFTGFHTLVVCRHLRKWLQLFIFKGENNLPTLLRRHALYRSWSMHPKYRIPSVAINVSVLLLWHLSNTNR